jgi:membrane dipeptidase
MKNKYSSEIITMHQKAIVLDSHNDILFLSLTNDLEMDKDLRGKAASDLRRWKEGMVDVQVFAVWCDDSAKKPFELARKQIALLDEIIDRNPHKIKRVHSCDEIEKIVTENKLAAMLGIEGGHMIENDLEKLNYFFGRGARYMTLTWNNSTDWASSAYDERYNTQLTHKGLSEFGRSVIKRMNELGMMIDVSHAGEQTFWDVIEISSKPIIASHSCVAAICPTQRNLTDEQIKAIAKSEGVIQVNFYSEFLDPSYLDKKALFLAKHQEEKDELISNGMVHYWADDFLFKKYFEEINEIRAPFSLLIDHIEYIINLVGVDFVGLGSDFDGMIAPPLELDDVSTFPRITQAFVEKGYSEEAIIKILGANFLRVLRANEKN